ncbi:hypothetical protein HAX54_052898 [Datura stramonium]|uniref:Uncharacterized protein n=1 Tax=Datura stramonium TaxID=4076 RepID=A0ABS8T074_DATST|nr:hypothetical protein [Datura stramonium]
MTDNGSLSAPLPNEDSEISHVPDITNVYEDQHAIVSPSEPPDREYWRSSRHSHPPIWMKDYVTSSSSKAAASSTLYPIEDHAFELNVRLSSVINLCR